MILYVMIFVVAGRVRKQAKQQKMTIMDHDASKGGAAAAITMTVGLNSEMAGMLDEMSTATGKLHRDLNVVLAKLKHGGSALDEYKKMCLYVAKL